MPVYEYQCPICGLCGDFRRSVEDRDDFPWCGECDVEMRRKWGISGVTIR